MTDEDSARLGRLSQWLVANAGGYLRNTLWVPEVTCGTCASPVEGYRRCFSCTDAERSHPGRIADLVVPVFYGIQGWQSGYLMYNYKGLPPQQRLRQTLSIALHLSWNLHRDCVARAVRSLPSVLATVPSTKGRTGVHPLDPVVDEARLGMPRTGLSAVHDPDQDKQQSPRPLHRRPPGRGSRQARSARRRHLDDRRSRAVSMPRSQGRGRSRGHGVDAGALVEAWLQGQQEVRRHQAGQRLRSHDVSGRFGAL